MVESKYAFPAPAGYEFVLEDAPEGNVCGDPVPADPLPVNVRGGDIGAVFTDDATFAGPGCSPADGVELFFARDMLAGETARIRDTGSVDLVLRVVGSCAPDAACLADRNEPENPGLTFTAPADGRYWFVAESYYSAPASTAYDVTVDDPPPGELCSDPRLVTAGDAIAGGDFTLDWANDLDFAGLGCTPASGAELVLAIYMAEAASVRIRELGSLDVVIRVLTACAPAASCLYNLDLPEDPGVLFYAVAAGWYYIVVESVNAFPAARAYDIRIDPA